MDEKMIAYCGLYCGHCFSRTHVAHAADVLRGYMKRQGFETFGPYMENYTEFWDFLGTLIDADGCPGCRADGGSPACVRRTCAREHQVEACPLCEDYPCEHYSWLDGAKNYPTLKDDNQYMQEHGLERWLEMQGERRASGFTYIEDREARELPLR